jgi:hypothetical protein
LPDFYDNSILEVYLTKALQYIIIHSNPTKKPVMISRRSWDDESGPQVPQVPKVPTVPKGPKGTKGPLGTVVEWPQGSLGALGYRGATGTVF